MIALKFDMPLDSSAAEVAVKFQSDVIIKLLISRLRDFKNSYDKTSYRILKRDLVFLS